MEIETSSIEMIRLFWKQFLGKDKLEIEFSKQKMRSVQI